MSLDSQKLIFFHNYPIKPLRPLQYLIISIKSNKMLLNFPMYSYTYSYNTIYSRLSTIT